MELKVHYRTWIMDLVFISVCLLVVFFLNLGERPLTIPDEGNYAEIAREMCLKQDYITPYLNEIKFLEKPALLYWMGALSFKWFGVNLWSLRCSNALLGFLGCVLLYGFGRQLFDRKTGILAAFILGTSGLYFMLAHLFTTDLPVTVAILATLLCFLLGAVQQDQRYLWLFAGVMAGVAILAKGLMGVVFPAGIIFLWLALTGQWHILKSHYLWLGIGCMCLVAIPWHWLVARNNPEFLKFYFIEHHFARFRDGSVGHPGAFSYYLPVILLGFFPWIMFLPQALKAAWPKTWERRLVYQKELFFLVWAVFILIFFSISKAKLIPYILPAFPPLAMLVALSFRNVSLISLRRSYLCVVIGAVLIGVAIAISIPHLPATNIIKTHNALAAAAIIIILGTGVSAYWVKRKWQAAVSILVLTMAFLSLQLLQAAGGLDQLSTQPLTDRLRLLLKKEDIVIGFNHHFQDLAFNLERPIYILNSRKLFAFGMQHQNAHPWLIEDEQFFKWWNGPTRVYAFIRKKDLKELDPKYQTLAFYPVAATYRNVLVTNIPMLKKLKT